MRIALIGTKAAGKMLVARHLEKRHNFKLMGMMDGVEKIYRSLYYHERYARVPWEKRTKIYDLFYDLEPTTWTHFLEKRLSTTTRPDIVVPDARYISELTTLQTLGFIVIRVILSDEKRPTPGRALLDTSSPGTILLNEYYGKDKIQARSTIKSDSRTGMLMMTDFLIESLKREEEK